MENQIPKITKLYFHDFVIKYSMNTIFSSVFVLAGMYWADPSTIKILPYITIPITLLGIVVFLLRYNFVASILREGIVIKGKVESLDRYERSEESASNISRKRVVNYSYYVTISYVVGGESYKKSFRLPNSGFVYGIHDKQEVDLMLKETSPRKVLIKNVYINRLR